jgi:hypothetical protein
VAFNDFLIEIRPRNMASNFEPARRFIPYHRIKEVRLEDGHWNGYTVDDEFVMFIDGDITVGLHGDG